MTTFDPGIEAQKLRDHLASHDKPISFLFGAGTSAAVRGTDGEPLIPAVSVLTERCATSVQATGAPFDEAWARAVDALPADRRTIEDVLSSIRQMRAAVLPGDRLAGLDSDQLRRLEREVQRAISREVRPDAGRVPQALPHQALGRWIQRTDRASAVEIFTANYDTLIERGLEREWVPVFDGFVGARRPFFSPASLAREAMSPGRRWTRLWKIHGSVTWSLERDGEGAERIVRGEERETGELILPSLLKYDESRKQPYVAILDRLRRVLSDREDAILVTAGYSFGDQHVNEVIFEALAANPRLHVFALCFGDPPAASQLVIAAKRRSNLLVYGRAGAIVGSRQGSWLLADPDAHGTRLDGLFSLDARASAGGPTSCRCELGDFNVLCRLLDAIAGADA